jgi:hypothetical protein
LGTLGYKHRPETRAKIAATLRTPEKRQEQSNLIKAKMADPAVRQRIRDGMRGAATPVGENEALQSAWNAARPAVRRRFLAMVLGKACE